MPKRSAPAVTPFDPARIAALRADQHPWELAFVRMPTWVTNDHDPPFRPLLAMCRPAWGGRIAMGGICAPGEPQGPAALAAVAQLAAMRVVNHRPSRIDVRDPALANAIRADLARAGIDVAVVESLESLDEAIAEVVQREGGSDLAERVYLPRIDIARVRAFAGAAADFYRAAPWNLLTDLDLVCIDSPAPPEGLACFTVMGAASADRAVDFFASELDYEHVCHTGEAPPAAEGMWFVNFDEKYDLPILDSELWEQHDLPLAADHAYPSFALYLPTGRMRPASPERLAFAEGLLRVLATLTHDELDTGRVTRTVATFDGPVSFVLSLPDVLAAPWGERAASPTAHTPQEKALDLLDRAYNEHGRLRVKLARAALGLWPDCSDACVILADMSIDPTRRIELYTHALAAAERVLGPEAFEQHAGEFWLVLETRPYMRARSGLASALWDAGQDDAAIAHWLDLLRLCPGDNLGLRDLLVPRLIECNRDAEAAEVIGRYEPCDTATLAYCAALLEFRRRGNDSTARERLADAVRRNAEVPKYLSGRVELPELLPDSFSRGSEAEAQIAANLLIDAYDDTEGATDWVARAIRPPKSERRAARAKGKGRR